MATIELVIRIPEDEYQNILHTGEASFCTVNAIEAGRPLPKGHGGLIDVDKLIAWCKSNDDKLMSEYYIDHIIEASTIIEADTESED